VAFADFQMFSDSRHRRLARQELHCLDGMEGALKYLQVIMPNEKQGAEHRNIFCSTQKNKDVPASYPC